MTTICGDCGDEIKPNPDKGPGREVTVEKGFKTGLSQQVTVYDQPEYLHADDNTPQCAGRDDAIRRKPGHFYTGG